MKYSMLISTSLSTLLLLQSNAVVADKFMSAAEVKALFSGKTFDGYNEIRDKHYRGYSAPDGTMTHQNSTGKIREIKWEVDETGRHCAIFPAKQLCGRIISMGNGVYHKIGDNDKHTNTLKNFVEGNKL